MRRRVLGITLTLCLAPAAAPAQNLLQGPVLPDAGLGTTVLGERDLYRVHPDFYRMLPDRPLTVPASPYFFPFYGAPPTYVFVVPEERDGRAARTSRRDSRSRRSRSDAPQGVAPPPASAALPPGPPRTFYVIPGCYAGDRRPEREWLPDGCDLAQLRVIPPRA